MKMEKYPTFRTRKNFGRIKSILDIPDLIDVQKTSYERFLQKETNPDERKDTGLQNVFKTVFPIHDINETCSLEFVKYFFEDVKYEEEECLKKSLTYEVPIKIVLQLLVFNLDEVTGSRNIRDIKEQEIYFGTFPMMTDRGTFIINGVERVIVSQLHRSPGVFFDSDSGKQNPSGKPLYSARIIPLRGSWIDFEFDSKDILHVRIDRRRKFPATTLLKAFGFSEEEVLRSFYCTEKILVGKDLFRFVLDPVGFKGRKLGGDIFHPESGELMAKEGERFSKKLYNKLVDAGLKEIPITSDSLKNRIVARDVIDPKTGEVLLRTNQPLDEEALDVIKESGVEEIELLVMDTPETSKTIRETMLLDKVATPEDAVLDIYRKLRPTSPPTQEMADVYFRGLFMKPQTYDLSQVGRLKINYRLEQDVPLDTCTLRKEDVMETVKELVRLNVHEGTADDIDDLGNRRVRSVGELLEEEYRVGMIRMQRAIKERMSLQDVGTLMPRDLINSKPVSAVINEFFGSSQLSQFMDQTNPLSEITHKRRLSALGPGGLTRERAGFEVRDVHPSHYGRICPIETPEGPNIGLIVSLGTYSRVNGFGFIETPYRKVKARVVSKNLEYLSAMDEKEYSIAQANTPIHGDGKFGKEIVAARKAGEACLVPSEEVKYMDVSPNQLVSIAASLIPFLEHDDANRALMGSNMQRQAVPLLRAKSPLIGTGIERVVAKHSGIAAGAKHDGVVESVDSSRIVIRPEEREGVDIYKLLKFRRSNQSTCYNQRPIVSEGERVEKGQIIADGPAMEKGELALGRNVKVAFLSWGGYNFEDAILVSERLVREDVFTSIHIEELNVVARDTKLGKEEITRDIPNVGEDALKNLDESGIILAGAEVRPGDILVGKITPKGETQLSPEEKLLRAIFGEKAGDVKDTSLRVPPGVEGIVIDAQIFSRRGIEKDQRTKDIQAAEIEQLSKDREDEVKVTKENILEKLSSILEGKRLKSDLREPVTGEILLERGKVIDRDTLLNIPIEYWQGANIDSEMETIEKMESSVSHYSQRIKELNNKFQQKIDKLNTGDELSPGVIKMVKVFVAVKRKLSVGDKMAGRHGNKGVISAILPIEDMPYFADGTPVDIVLNPLGVPSRMNVGQILETHLGWAAYEIGQQIGRLIDNLKDKVILRERLKDIYSQEEYEETYGRLPDEELEQGVDSLKEGIHMATPVFDGAKEEEIVGYLNKAGLPVSGQTTLYDGRTGEAFDHPVTVGIMYMMKLHHLVDDKIHARSIGPYSLVTQQPLGGKAQFGGQRLGEMEVWAMESYGASYSLQEFLTVKSDDVSGRTRMYEKIVKGNNILEAGLPESFNVLVKELQSLGLEIELSENDEL